MRLIDLKTICKDRGLRVSGNKAEVIIRLMENDESVQPESITLNTSSSTTQSQFHGNQPITQIIIHNNANISLQITGVGIIFYGLFRMGMAILFNEWTPFESLLAMIIGFGYLLGGVLTIQAYKEGLYLTLVVLLFSGIMSLIYHDEWSPLSMGMGGIWPLGFSLVCSGICMVFVAAPLMGAGVRGTHFREDSPNFIPNILKTANYASPLPNYHHEEEYVQVKTKIVVTCVHCNSKLKVPSDYKGRVKCPTCNERFQVQ